MAAPESFLFIHQSTMELQNGKICFTFPSHFNNGEPHIRLRSTVDPLWYGTTAFFWHALLYGVRQDHGLDVLPLLGAGITLRVGARVGGAEGAL